MSEGILLHTRHGNIMLGSLIMKAAPIMDFISLTSQGELVYITNYSQITWN